MAQYCCGSAERTGKVRNSQEQQRKAKKGSRRHPPPKAHPNVFGVQAVFAPRRRDAAVQVGARATHVQLVLVRLRGNVVSHLRAREQELWAHGRKDNSLDEPLTWSGVKNHIILVDCWFIFAVYYKKTKKN